MPGLYSNYNRTNASNRKSRYHVSVGVIQCPDVNLVNLANPLIDLANLITAVTVASCLHPGIDPSLSLLQARATCLQWSEPIGRQQHSVFEHALTTLSLLMGISTSQQQLSVCVCVCAREGGGGGGREGPVGEFSWTDGHTPTDCRIPIDRLLYSHQSSPTDYTCTVRICLYIYSCVWSGCRVVESQIAIYQACLV